MILPDSLTVACVLRSGGVYTAEWVCKLRDGVARNLTVPHRFICLTDLEHEVEGAGVEVIRLPKDWKGWWSKLCLFAPGLITGRALYLDLDTIVVGSLDEIAAYRHHFTMAHEFYRPSKICSTVMAWEGDYSFLYHAFAEDPERIAAKYDAADPDVGIGDQAFCEDQMHLTGHRVDTFRDLFGVRSIASYKVDRCQDGPPADAAVVCFHGFPKQHQIATGWVPKLWT